MIKIKTKDVRHIVDATFPDYHKREVIIEARETVTMYDLNWSGGTKNEYRACGIDGTTNGKRVDTGRLAPWNNPYEGMVVPIPVDCIVAECGYFCGQVRIMRLHVNPANMPRLLAA